MKAARSPFAWVSAAAYIAAVYSALMLTDPGKLDADTKSYLYLDPSRLLTRAVSLWNPHIALGTLSHQTIGYLFPMGPFFWILERGLGIAPWVAQRLWLGTLIVGAGFGVRYLMRCLGVGGPGIAVAVLAYSFTPYLYGYAGLYSALLLPWVALPWWIGLAIRGLPRGGWKYPVLFALSVQVIGSVNGSALMFALLGPALWIVFTVFFAKEQRWTHAWSLIWRTGLLTTLTSLWWLVPLAVEGKYGVNFLKYTESLRTVATTSAPFEPLRGLGNWFFYGRDPIGFWIDARPFYTQQSFFIVISFLVPAASFLAAGLVRWKHKTFFVALAVIGTIVCVGASPYDDPSAFGALFKALSTRSDAALALRNLGRALPLVAVSLAVLLGVGVTTLSKRLVALRLPRPAFGVVLVTAAICLVNAFPFFSGHVYDSYLETTSIPAYWKRAIADLDQKSHSTRVLALPGSDFASYRWGDTRDPIEPGLMDRPYVARELVPWGSPASFNLIAALDHRVQEGWFEPQSLPALARLLGVGDVLVRSDLATDRFSLIEAGKLWSKLNQKPIVGLSGPKRYGTTIPGELKFPEISDLTKPATSAASPPPVAVYSVNTPASIVRAQSPTGAFVVAGDGEGIVDLAAAGLLNPQRILSYSASRSGDSPAFANDSILVLTDSNRKRGQRWSGIHDNAGYTETAGERPFVIDPTDQRFTPFPDASDDTRTVVAFDGIRNVQATSYGEGNFGYTPQYRAFAALDRDPNSAWTFGTGSPLKTPQRWVLSLVQPTTASEVRIVQYSGKQLPSSPTPRRIISHVTLIFDGKDEVPATLTEDSRSESGTVVSFPTRTFRSFEIRVDGVIDHSSVANVAKNAVGFAEVVLQDAQHKAILHPSEWLMLPRDLLAGSTSGTAASANHPVIIVLSREPTMDSANMNRKFTLPTRRSFSMQATARLSIYASDVAIDASLGLAQSDTPGGLTATAANRLEPVARASSAFDGDPNTAWQPPVNVPLSSVQFQIHDPIALHQMRLELLQDGRHSIPTELVISGGAGGRRVVAIPGDGAIADGRRSVNLEFPVLRSDHFTIKVSKATLNRSGDAILPVGIAEFGIDGAKRAALPKELPRRCDQDAVTIDGRAVPLRIRGSVAQYLGGATLPVEFCGGDSVDLPAGSHRVSAGRPNVNADALDVTRMTFGSDRSSAAKPALAMTRAGGAPAPTVTLTDVRDSSMTVHVSKHRDASWLVLGQSFNAGWSATIGGKSLGLPVLVNGYANGWLLPANADSATVVRLEWAPQRTINFMLIISAVSVVGCFGILVGVRRRSRLGRHAGARTENPMSVEPSWDPTGGASQIGLGKRRREALVLLALFGALAVKPWVGSFVVLAWIAIERYPRARRAAAWAPGLLIGGVGFGIAVAQAFARYAPRFNWVDFFGWARIPTWIAIFTLLVHTMADVRNRDGESAAADSRSSPVTIDR